MRRVILSLILLPIAVMLAAGVTSCVLQPVCQLDQSLAAAVAPLGLLLILFPLQSLLAGPTFYVLLRLGYVSWLSCLIAGLAVGFLGHLPQALPALFDAHIRLSFRIEQFASIGSPMLIWGLIAIAFWSAALFRNREIGNAAHSATLNSGSESESAA